MSPQGVKCMLFGLVLKSLATPDLETGKTLQFKAKD